MNRTLGKAAAQLAVVAIATTGIGVHVLRGADSPAPWLSRVNKYRAMAKLDPVGENESLGNGDAAHAKYLVQNYSQSLRAGQPLGVDLHVEERGRAGFTYAGFVAGRASDVLIISGTPAPTWAIDTWVIAPFHRLPLLDPGLKRAGYGDFCADQICAAAINVSSDSTSPDMMLRRRITSGIPITGESEALGGGWGTRFQAPVEFPPNGSVIESWQFEKGEWPDPLTSCPGFSYPSGIPITLQMGRYLTPRIEKWSLRSGGTNLEACAFDSKDYINPDQLTQKLGRGDLEAFGAVVLIPRTPLRPQTSYDVMMRVDDVSYSWSFSTSAAQETTAIKP